MGIDLTLLPLRGPQQMGDTLILCHDRLSFDRDYEIFGQLINFGEGKKPIIKASSIPPQMWVETYEDDGIKRHREDDYGTELTFVYAQQLKKLRVADDASPKNKAIKAFVGALPDDTPIILLWW